MEYQLINGKILRAEEALIPLNDLGLLRGYSVFDYFRVIDGVPVFLEEHAARLIASCNKMDLELNRSADEIQRLCIDLIDANGGTIDAGMRIVVTGGFALDGFTPAESNLFITLHPLPQYAPTDYTQGRCLISSNYTRSMAEVKTTSYSHVLTLRKKVKEANAIEVLYHTNGLITECSRANIFFVRQNGTIVTPLINLLSGITRKHVIQLAKSSGYQVEETEVRMDDLANMKEVFLSSTTKGVMPITRIDDIVIGDGQVGEVTGNLREQFLELVRSYIATHRREPLSA